MPENTQGFSLKIGTGPNFGFKADPDFLFFGENDSTLIKSAVFVDDIFDFFPSAQLNISDQSGELTEKFGFVESLNFNCEIADLRVNDFVRPSFYWADDQLQATLLSDHLSGTHVWKFISKFRQDDKITSNAWGKSTAQYIGVNIKEPILDTLKSYVFKKSIIKGVRNGTAKPDEGPQNVDIFYQPNIYDFDFIRDLALKANDDSNSPYTTFINMNDEFYFTTIADLESQQIDKDLRFKMEVSPLQSLEDDQINRYSIMHGGVNVNEKNYKSLNYFRDFEGSLTVNENSVKQYFKQPKIQSDELGNSRKFKYFVRGQYLNQLRAIHDFGILDSKLQTRNFKGWVANRHLDSMMSNRIVAIVPFRGKASAGRTVQLDFKDDISDQLSRYAGKWTILRCEHHWNGKNRKLTDKLTLFRSGMDIPDHARDPFTFIAKDF